jgi:CRISPR/Cas system CSM-associated protein Csm3 (group 7 of RAMP superfamily)
LLIRSGFGDSNGPDFVHLRSKCNGEEVPVLSGTSLAGALRARALRISNTLGKDSKKVTNDLFGYRRAEGEGQRKLTSSRLWVEESVIQNALDLVHTRVKIDRFTGGSYPAALFSEQPVFGKLNEETTLRVQLTLENPIAADEPPKVAKQFEARIGLLLLLLKDLWTGDLPLGGESSVGRGRVRGKQAVLRYDGSAWTLTQGQAGTLQVEGDRTRLEEFVRAFVEEE